MQSALQTEQETATRVQEAEAAADRLQQELLRTADERAACAGTLRSARDQVQALQAQLTQRAETIESLRIELEVRHADAEVRLTTGVGRPCVDRPSASGVRAGLRP